MATRTVIPSECEGFFLVEANRERPRVKQSVRSA